MMLSNHMHNMFQWNAFEAQLEDGSLKHGMMQQQRQ